MKKPIYCIDMICGLRTVAAVCALLCASLMACSEETEPTGGPEQEAVADDEDHEFSIEDYVSGNPIDGSKGLSHLKPAADECECEEIADQNRHDECCAKDSDDSFGKPEGSISYPSSTSAKSSSSARELPSSSSVSTSSASENYVITNRIIMGVAEKGPFQAKSSVTIFEVDEDLNITGNVLGAETSDDQGTFFFPRVNLISDYVMLQAQGNFRNEVTGIWSQIPITLVAISNLSTRNGEPFQRTEVNVNLLTHLEYERVWTLMDEGLDFASAKKQAVAEIMNAFHFKIDIDYAEEQKLFGGKNGALLALSILFTANRNEVQLEWAINLFIDDIAYDGVWDDKVTHANVADFASEFNTESVHTWAANWGYKSVPEFEIFLAQFWHSAYGLGLCTAKNQGFVVENTNSYSSYYMKKYTCKDGEWVRE